MGQINSFPIYTRTIDIDGFQTSLGDLVTEAESFATLAASSASSAQSSQLSAAASSAAAGAASGRLDVGSFAELATRFNYDGTAGREMVAEDDIVRWGNFLYRVAGSGATDEHLDYTGSGGVKLYVEVSGEGWNAKAFGAAGDGATSDVTAAQKTWDAAKAAGGGVMHFPAGTYPVNIVGLGSDNVSIKGENSASILISFAGNDWAVKIDGGYGVDDNFIKDIGFIDDSASKTTHGAYINTASGINLHNVTFRGLGIGFCNNATYGFSFASCSFLANYVDCFSTCSTGANTSIATINCQTVEITEAFFPQHPGIMLFTDCLFTGRVNHYYEQPDNPFPSETALQYINCTLVPSGGGGIYLVGAGWQHSVTATQLWLEGTLGTTTIRATAFSGKYVYSDGCDVTIKDSFVSNIDISGDTICTLENCRGGDSSNLTASGVATFCFDNFVSDSLGGTYLPWFVKSARGRYQIGRAPYFHTTPKTNINRVYSGNKKDSNRCFAADTIFVDFGGTTTKITSDSAFETLESFQVVATAGNGAYPLASVSVLNTKVYVITIALRAVTASFPISISCNIASMEVTPPVDRWQTYAVLGTPTANGTDSMLMLNQGSGSRTWRVSGVQYLEFNNYSEAYEFLASSSFTL